MIGEIARSIAHLPTVQPIEFTRDAAEFTRLWNIRKGLLASAGAVRPPGTTVLIEDIAVPVDALDRATLDSQALFRKHDYKDAIIFGHALEGTCTSSFRRDSTPRRKWSVFAVSRTTCAGW